MTSVSRDGTKTIVSFVCPAAGLGWKASTDSATASPAVSSRTDLNRFTTCPSPDVRLTLGSDSNVQDTQMRFLRFAVHAADEPRVGYRPADGTKIPDAPAGVLLALLEGNERARGRAGVVSAGPEQFVMILLHGVGAPAADAGGGEDRGAEVDRNPQRVVHDGGEEVDIDGQVADAVH